MREKKTMHRSIIIFAIVCISLFVISGLSAQDSENIEQIGRLYSFWDNTEAIDVQGNYAYAAAGLSGLQILDVSNPESLFVTGYFDNIGDGVIDLVIEGNMAYLAASNSGFVIVDVSDPEQPFEVGFCDTPGSAIAVDVSENYAYVIDSYAIRIIDISDPENPHETGFFITNGYNASVTVENDFAYVAGNDSLFVIDISNHDQPMMIGTCETPGNGNGICKSGSYVYIAVGDAGLCVVDITNPDEPTLVSTLDTEGYVGNVQVSENYGYAADHVTGLCIIDISNPQQLVEVGRCATPGTAKDVAISDNQRVYVADWAFGIRVIDIEIPDNPEEIGFYNVPGNIEDIKVLGDFAFVTAGEAGLLIMDVSDPENPLHVSACNTGGYANEVCVSGNYAYIADNDGLFVVDLTDIENPEITGYFEGNSYDVVISEEYAYLVTHDCLRVIDISNPANPIEICTFQTGDPWRGCVTIVDDYAYLGFSTQGNELPCIAILDISNPRRLAEIIRFSTDVDFHCAMGISVYGSYACLATRSIGVRFFDISNFEDNVEVGYYRLCNYTSANDVILIDRTAYVAFDKAGISILDIINPRIPEEVGYFDTPGRASGIDVENDLIYLADGTNVGIYRNLLVENAVVSDEDVPNTFNLLAAYPNPFNARTTLTYSLPIQSQVSVQVLDISGRSIANLVNGLQPAGNHSVVWNGHDAGSGVYFVRMETADFSEVRKVMLLR